MHSKLHQVLDTLNPEWHDVREGIELLFNDENRPPTATFENLCAAVSVWGTRLDSLQVAMILGGKESPRRAVKVRIAEWLKEQLRVYCNREKSKSIAGNSQRMNTG